MNHARVPGIEQSIGAAVAVLCGLDERDVRVTGIGGCVHGSAVRKSGSEFKFGCHVTAILLRKYSNQ
jgi:hypothetical protein